MKTTVIGLYRVILEIHRPFSKHSNQKPSLPNPEGISPPSTPQNEGPEAEIKLLEGRCERDARHENEPGT